MTLSRGDTGPALQVGRLALAFDMCSHSRPMYPLQVARRGRALQVGACSPFSLSPRTQ